MLELATPSKTEEASFLADLLSPIEPQKFFEHYWEQRHLLIHRQNPSHYGPVFSFEDLDRYLTMAAKNSSARLSVGKTSDKGVSLRDVRVEDTDPKQLYKAFHQGSTLMLAAIDRCWPPAAKLAADFGAAFGGRAKINVYITPPGTQGAPIHPDIQEVFVLQMEGSKDWFIYDERFYEPVENLTHQSLFGDSGRRFSQDPPLAERALLEPGDLLYLPRGVLHRAIAPTDTPSLHLTVCVTPLCEVDFLKAAVEIVSTECPELSRALPKDFDRQAPARETLRQRFLSALEQMSDERFFERTADVMGRVKMSLSPPSGDGHFEQLLRLEDIQLDREASRRRWQHCQVKVSEQSALIQFGTGQMKGPASLAPALEYIRDHSRFLIADLPGLTDDSKLVLVKRLVQDGLLRLVPTESE